MKIICAISFQFLFFACIAQHAIEVQSRYVVDESGQLPLSAVDFNNAVYFAEGETISVGYNINTAIWCRFDLHNTDSVRRSNWLCLDNNHLDSVQIFDQSNVILLGDRTERVSPFLTCQAFRVSLRAGEYRTIYVKMKKGISLLEFSYFFTDRSHLDKDTRRSTIQVSFIAGIIFLLVLINLFLYLVNRKSLYFYYIVYSLLAVIYMMINSGFAKYALFPQFLYFSECRIYASSLWFVSLSLFLADYMQLRLWQPMKYRAIMILVLINVSVILCTLALVVTQRYEWLQALLNFGLVNFGIIVIIILAAAVVHLRISRINALYVLLTFMPHLIWTMSIILKNLKMISDPVPLNGFVFISLYEVFLFGYVLMKDYIETFRANNKLIRDIVKEKESSLEAVTFAQIRERRQIANVIHDNFGSKIAHVLHLIELKQHEEAQQSIKELTHEIRDVSHQIMPKSLEEGALISSLQTQIAYLNKGRKHCSIELYQYDFPERLEVPWVHNIYLISLEIIHNALKHAAPTSILLEFFCYPDVYVFQFTDDGKGFDPISVPRGFGLNTIDKRIASFNGTFELNSKPGEGTVIQISIPSNK